MKNSLKNKIIKLRKITNFSILECKNTLVKFNNNINLSLNYLNEKNSKFIINKKNIDSNKNYSIFSKVSNDNKYALIFKIVSDTDFTLKNKKIVKLSKEILEYCIFNKIKKIEDIKNKFKNDFNILTKKFNENIYISDFCYIINKYVKNYLYKNKISLIISLKKNNLNEDIFKQICMHIIFNKPLYINFKNIPIYIIKKYIKKYKNSSNNKEIYKKNINSFLKNIILTKQKFLLNTNKIISDILLENKIIINKFKVL